MSDPRPPRRPTAIRLDDPEVDLADVLGEPIGGRTRVTMLPDTLPGEAERAIVTHPKRKSPWWTVLWSAGGGLVSLGIGLWATNLIENLFATSPTLGLIGIGLAALFLVALLAIVGREVIALLRLGRVERLHEQAVGILLSDDEAAARRLVAELQALYARRPTMARARAELDGHLREIVDGADLVRLAERTLLSDVDRQALKLVTDAAKRVSLVTAISPRAVFDVAVVVAQSARLIRMLADLYGARPGGVGSWRLMRQVAAHLAITGGMAVGDTVVQQLVGHGLAARLSAKLGEGVINGLLTARVGLVTIDLVRPLPFSALDRPKLASIMAELTRSTTKP